MDLWLKPGSDLIRLFLNTEGFLRLLVIKPPEMIISNTEGVKRLIKSAPELRAPASSRWFIKIWAAVTQGVNTELQQVCSRQIAVSQTQTAAVRFLPQLLQENTHSSPAGITLALHRCRSSWNKQKQLLQSHFTSCNSYSLFQTNTLGLCLEN